MDHGNTRNKVVAPGFILICAFLVAAGLFPACGEDEPRSGGWLGVSVREHKEAGVVLLSVAPRSPADLAGLRTGDWIVEVSGATDCDVACLGAKVRNVPPGSVLSMRIVRNDSEREFAVTLGSIPREYPSPDRQPMEWKIVPEAALIAPEILLDERLDRFFQVVPDAPYTEIWFPWRDTTFGADLIEITPELRLHLGGPRDNGMLVGAVEPDSPAGEAGILAGDLIVKLDENLVAGKQDLLLFLTGRSGEEFLVNLVRKGEPRTVSVRMQRFRPPIPPIAPAPSEPGRNERATLQRVLLELEKSLKEQEMSRELRRSLDAIREELDRLTPDRP